MNATDRIRLGLPGLDQQHWILADCLASIELSVTEKGRTSAVNAALDRLVDLSRLHCTDEETLMRAHDYPDSEEHAEEHRQLLSYMEKLRDGSIGNEDSLSMMVFIQQWLREHIRTGDRRYASYLASAGIKQALHTRNSARKSKSPRSTEA